MNEEKISDMLKGIQEESMIPISDFISTFKKYLSAKENNDLVYARELIRELIPMAKKILMINSIIEYSNVVCEEYPLDIDTSGLDEKVEMVFNSAAGGDLDTTLEVAKDIPDIIQTMENEYGPVTDDKRLFIDERFIDDISISDGEYDHIPRYQDAEMDDDTDNEVLDEIEQRLDEITEEVTIEGIDIPEEGAAELEEQTSSQNDGSTIEEGEDISEGKPEGPDLQKVESMPDIIKLEGIYEDSLKIHQQLTELKTFDIVKLPETDKKILLEKINHVIDRLVQEDFEEASSEAELLIPFVNERL
ncbi:MAG: hypothetical protein R6U17_08030 [Thermoplasmata archaeon]